MSQLAPIRFAAVIFFGLLVVALANAQDKPADKPTDEKKESAKAKATKIIAAPKVEAAKPGATLPKDVKKLIVEDTIPGNGKVAAKGKTIKVHYTGWLYDPTKPMGRGKQFDTSAGKEAFSFLLGGGKVIKGWDEGFENMKVGGKRKLIIPSEMAYGEGGAGDVIPPNTALMFEVELLDAT